MEPQFKNSAKPIAPAYPRYYGYDNPSPYLFVYSRLLQGVVSQAGTYLLTGKFHTHQPGIYKSEGGCHIEGVGDLVLSGNCCYFDYDTAKTRNNQAVKLAALITDIVLNWDPMDPVNSMTLVAANHIKCPIVDLTNAVANTGSGGPFGADALSSFFDWNPFCKAPIDRDYLRYVLITFQGKTNEEVNQKYADEDLGDSLLTRINAKMKELAGGKYGPFAMYCQPSRDGDNLKFWVNTGERTNVDGWKTQAELEDFIANATEVKNPSEK